MSFSKISAKLLVVAVLVAFSLVMMLTAVITANNYKQNAFQASKEISGNFIQVTLRQAQADLDRLLSELSTEFQSDRNLRKSFKQHLKTNDQASVLVAVLNQPFKRRYVTAGLMDLEKLRFFDKELNYVAQSDMGIALPTSLNAGIKSRAQSRSKSERLKPLKAYWSSDEGKHFTYLVPIGGLRVLGYVEIVINPVYNLKSIEQPLQSPLSVYYPDGTLKYQSKNWPQDESQYVLADYDMRSADTGENILRFVAAIDSAELVAGMNNTRNITLLIFVSGAVLFTLLAFYLLNKTLFKPMSSLVKEMTEASSGNLAVSVDDFGVKEVHILSNTLEAFVTELSNKLSVIMSETVALQEASSHLMTHATNTRDGVNVQSTELEQISTAMSEMASTVQHISENAVAASGAADEANTSVEEGRATVMEGIRLMNDLSKELQSTEALTLRLNADSETIGSIIDVILGIAEQTNLLALNAAIEAARAGETGRGFAVVADEVRSLATRTQESANEIRAMIESLRDGNMEVIGVMESSRENSLKAVESINSAGERFGLMANCISQMTDMNTQIATSTEEQAAVADEIQRNVVRAHDVTYENLDLAKNVTNESESLNSISKKMHDLVCQFVLRD